MATNNQTPRGSAQAGTGKTGTDSRSSVAGTSRTSNRGFASMDPEAQRRIASEGGRASHASGRGHEWTSQEAREAGRKGGQASRSNAQASAQQKSAPGRQSSAGRSSQQ
ncbi:KGG domain-containing protein [Hymenobacter sp. B81]|uniref:KGG domain-containing protein n=1 Tax=Hymenobacter sp. B81 TaxID=3344878 RepID=UPI0037DD7789